MEKWTFDKVEHGRLDDHSKAYFPHSEESIKTQNFEGKTLISLNVQGKNEK